MLPEGREGGGGGGVDTREGTQPSGWKAFCSELAG